MAPLLVIGAFGALGFAIHKYMEQKDHPFNVKVLDPHVTGHVDINPVVTKDPNFWGSMPSNLVSNWQKQINADGTLKNYHGDWLRNKADSLEQQFGSKGFSDKLRAISKTPSSNPVIRRP